MKTAISIPDDLFKSVDELAEETDRSRSQVFSDAVRAYLQQQDSEKILRSLNKVYSGTETQEEIAVRKRGKKRYVTILQDSPW